MVRNENAGKQAKGQKICRKKNQQKKCIKKTQWINNHAEIRTYTMTASSAWGQLPDHWALLLLDNSYRTIKILTAFFSAIHAIWSLSSCIYHEFKEILRKISLSKYFKAISLYFCVYSLSGLTAARYIYTSSSSSLFALDFKSPFSLQWSGKSSATRIPGHLLNETLSCACRSLSVVWETDRDSQIVNIVWQTMNKDISLSWTKHDSAAQNLKSCWKCTLTSQWMRKLKRYIKILPTRVSASPRDTRRDKFIGRSLREE